MDLEWEFVALAHNDKSEPTVAPLSPEQKLRTKEYKKALITAAKTDVSHPIFSGYFVRESIYRPGSKRQPRKSGNLEYGFLQADHGEQVSVAASLSYDGPMTKEGPGDILAIITPGFAAPCGNCRDVTNELFGPKLHVVSGPREGGRATVATLADFLFEVGPKQEISIRALEGKNRLTSLAIDAFHRGGEIADNPYGGSDKHPRRDYRALLVTDRAKYYGAHDIMCDYHPIYAGRDASRQARRKHDYSIRYALFVVAGQEGESPDIMYKDRQHLMEHDLIGKLLKKETETDTPVYLATVNSRHNEVTNLWRTTIREQLPVPFNPAKFGPEFVDNFTQYYRSRN